jgi:gas vesicle protein
MPSVQEPIGRPYTETGQFGTLAVIGVFAIGAIVGAAGALLYAPESGEETREAITRRVRRLTRRERSTWKRLRKALLRAAATRRAKRRADEVAERGAARVDVEIRPKS